VAHGLAQALAVQELHDQVRPALILAEIVNRDDVLVVCLAGDARLAEETRAGLGVARGRFVQNLDCNLASQQRIPRPVHLRHPPAQQLFELVFADAGRGIHQVTTSARAWGRASLNEIIGGVTASQQPGTSGSTGSPY
jgi:hypothetical protein